LALLGDAVENERYRTLTSTFMLMALEHPLQDMGRSWLALKDGSARERANAVELLDSLLPKELKRKLLPLLEPSGNGDEQLPSHEQVIRRLVAGPDAWPAACALYAARKCGISCAVAEGNRDMNGERSMTVVERAIALRKVDAFSGVPMDQLAHVAAAAREVSFPAGDLLFMEGEPPLSLFVMLEGRVQLEKEGKSFGEAVAGEPLGTWSIFDDHPRRATAKVVEDARVLVLDREDFYEVVAEHVDITRSLVQDLVRRLIELTKPSAEECR